MQRAHDLVEWFLSDARDLPWRTEPRDGYRVVVSELMLQQTQVDRVVPRFEAFVARFPDWTTLAAADENEVLAAWSGLGYYRRARLLHDLARAVAGRSAGLPRTADELRRLPGLGPYTAAAVASMVFGERVPVLDGNVIRVAARSLALPGDARTAAARRRLESWVDRLIGELPAGVVNEALMELGATVCLPTSPACHSCPLAGGCVARRQGNPEDFPQRRARRAAVDVRWVAVCPIDPTGRWLLRRVTSGPILRGLWLPPVAELCDGARPLELARELVPDRIAAEPVVLAEVRHTITHRRIRVVPVRLELARARRCGPDECWVDPARARLPTSTLLEKLMRVNDIRS